MLAPLLTDINETAIQVTVSSPASYTGGFAISSYELDITTEPPLVFETIDLGVHLPATHTMLQRKMSHSYVFKVRAINHLGGGAHSAELKISSGASELPDIPENLAVVDGLQIYM